MRQPKRGMHKQDSARLNSNWVERGGLSQRNNAQIVFGAPLNHASPRSNSGSTHNTKLDTTSEMPETVAHHPSSIIHHPGLVAIVGRPNVGKSALFNRIVGRRIAIVHDQPGVTRDRITAEAEWRGHAFTLVDTGGIGMLRGEKAKDAISSAALAQVELAIEAASVILLVVNVQEGV